MKTARPKTVDEYIAVANAAFSDEELAFLATARLDDNLNSQLVGDFKVF